MEDGYISRRGEDVSNAIRRAPSCMEEVKAMRKGIASSYVVEEVRAMRNS